MIVAAGSKAVMLLPPWLLAVLLVMSLLTAPLCTLIVEQLLIVPALQQLNRLRELITSVPTLLVQDHRNRPLCP